MGVGEAHPLRRKAVDVRCGDLPGPIEAMDITIAQVVGQDVDDIGPFRSVRGSRGVINTK